jgi:hypothetical protein
MVTIDVEILKILNSVRKVQNNIYTYIEVYDVVHKLALPPRLIYQKSTLKGLVSKYSTLGTYFVKLERNWAAHGRQLIFGGQ